VANSYKGSWLVQVVFLQALTHLYCKMQPLSWSKLLKHYKLYKLFNLSCMQSLLQ